MTTASCRRESTTASWDEIVTRYATNARRRELLDGLLDAPRSLKAVEPRISTAVS